MSDESGRQLIWHRALAADELPEGRVSQVTCENWTVCMTNVGGTYGALDNRCPHQGGPLGEGSIENGMLRCPWHGWDFDPLSGKPPGGFDDGVQTYPVEVLDDGVYVGFPAPDEHVCTVSDVMVETMANWGIRWVWGMVGHSNLGLADALRRQEEAGRMRYIGIRHEGAASFAASAYGKLTGLWDAHVDRAPVLALTGQVDSQVLGPGAFQEVDLQAAFGGVGGSVAATSQQAEVAERWALWRDEKQSREADDHGKGVSAAAVFAAMNRTVPEDAIMPVDVGNNTYSFGRYFECTGQAILMSGYLGSIGFGLPAALGAWAATQEEGTPLSGRPVVSVSGDGGFGQYMAELTTAVKYGMNITHVLLNNSELAKISKEQRAGQWDVWQTSLVNPEFAAFATNCVAFAMPASRRLGSRPVALGTRLAPVSRQASSG